MKRHPYVPDRGDVVWIAFDPQAGHDQAGRRPGLVLSKAAYNGLLGLALFCPITSRSKGYPFEVAIPDGLLVSGVVLSDQIKSLDWKARNVAKICSVPHGVVAEVVKRVATLLVI